MDILTFRFLLKVMSAVLFQMGCLIIELVNFQSGVTRIPLKDKS